MCVEIFWVNFGLQDIGKFGPKTGLTFSEDLSFFFLFWPSPNFGPKTGLISNEDVSFFYFVLVFT